jgi:AcrR family transcriptional regulator
MVDGSTAAGKTLILEQAQRLFSVHGYHGVSIRDIAQACDLSNAALYYHFGSKQNLYFEVLKAHISAVVRCLEEAGAEPGACRERLARAAHAYAQMILEYQGAILVLLRDLAQFDWEEIQQMLPDLGRRAPAAVAEILEEGIAVGEIKAVDTQRVGALLLGMVNALAVRRLQQPGMERSLGEDVDLAMDVLFEGVAIRTTNDIIVGGNAT